VVPTLGTCPGLCTLACVEGAEPDEDVTLGCSPCPGAGFWVARPAHPGTGEDLQHLQSHGHVAQRGGAQRGGAAQQGGPDPFPRAHSDGGWGAAGMGPRPSEVEGCRGRGGLWLGLWVGVSVCV